MKKGPRRSEGQAKIKRVKIEGSNRRLTINKNRSRNKKEKIKI